MSSDASLLASISLDRSVKVFDVRTLDMMAMLRLPFIPACVEWIFKVLSTHLAMAKTCVFYTWQICCTPPPSVGQPSPSAQALYSGTWIAMSGSHFLHGIQAALARPWLTFLQATCIASSPTLVTRPLLCTLQAGDSKSRLAIADRDSPDVYVYDVKSGSNDPLETFRVGHAAPIAAMRFNAPHDAVISVDTRGVCI